MDGPVTNMSVATYEWKAESMGSQVRSPMRVRAWARRGKVRKGVRKEGMRRRGRGLNMELVQEERGRR